MATGQELAQERLRRAMAFQEALNAEEVAKAAATSKEANLEQQIVMLQQEIDAKDIRIKEYCDQVNALFNSRSVTPGPDTQSAQSQDTSSTISASHAALGSLDSRSPATTPAHHYPPNTTGLSRYKVYAPINPAYPTVVRIDGKVVDISCSECWANASTKALFSGVRGLMQHYTRSHDEYVSVAQVARRCRKEELSAEDVERIVGGKTPRTVTQRVINRRARKGVDGKYDYDE
ncbi:hypothetical protein LTR09_008840 [Extremus antarcticus]|uniref:Uncharacterized protein n=1 Tax=Extremus antarcticus TaxID=702011 RepID=A0AAJ0DGS6_9PEZI|nr:hypothetical protein LTR09_008840 [Extremus antarcticus]